MGVFYSITRPFVRWRWNPNSRIQPVSVHALSLFLFVPSWISYLRIPPCSHNGPCNRTSPECQCFAQSQECQRNCRCSLDCTFCFPFTLLTQYLLMPPLTGQRRRKGCKCSYDKSRMCSRHTCPCRHAGRECDPELCKRCDARQVILVCLRGFPSVNAHPWYPYALTEANQYTSPMQAWVCHCQTGEYARTWTYRGTKLW